MPVHHPCKEEVMSKVLLPVATQGEIFRIPNLIEEAGIQVEATTIDDNTVYVCKKEDAAATVVPTSRKETVRDPQSGEFVQDYYPVLIAPKPGLFRWLFHGASDRRLQQAIVNALNSIALKPDA
jgi:hypothetical protein